MKITKVVVQKVNDSEKWYIFVLKTLKLYFASLLIVIGSKQNHVPDYPTSSGILIYRHTNNKNIV